MSRRTLSWILLSALSFVSMLVALFWFDRAFPVVTLDLKMDRALALRQASDLARELDLGPDGFTQAASFGVDQSVQNYVELEAGGPDGLRQLIRSGLYPPYRWTVRHFREGEITEARIYFTPEGTAAGFRLNLPEAAPGAQLEPESARILAENELPRWGIKLETWSLVESTTESRTGGRRDHQFVYEFQPRTLGEARYRFVVTVAGDRVTRAEPVIRLPESFGRRYQEMRSANNTLALAAGMVVGLVYLAGGCGLGLFFLLRRRALLWREALGWGALIGTLQFLAGLNQYPLIWMRYDTALSSGQHILRWVLGSLGEGLATGALLGFVFLVAEGLSRQAFPGHLQLWKVWSAETGASRQVAHQTLVGYLLVPIFFAYETGLYFLTRSRFGWWSPSDSLIHPDTLASLFPWLNPIAISLQAGLGEECLFRAVPLAGAALLGRRFGRPFAWIGAALIFQAVVFGAAHANYATQPFYARMVELILPSLLFGGLYMVYGLLPAVILHFAFDVVWFALPVFVASSGAIRDDQLLVVALTLVPLWVVFYRRFRTGAWTHASGTARNAAWSPPLTVLASAPLPVLDAPPPLQFKWKAGLAAVGVMGFALWVALWESTDRVPGLHLTRGQAEDLARDFVRKTPDLSLQALADPDWSVLSRVEADPDPASRFVWETSGADVYYQLLGTYLEASTWLVRFVRFDGPIEERVEELRVRLDGRGEILQVTHNLPEHRPGASLERDDALALATMTASAHFGIREELRLITLEASQLPARRDWTVVLTDPGQFVLQEGDTRIRVRISGDRVTDLSRFVFVPETWSRDQRSRSALLQILHGGCGLMLYLLVLAGAVIGILAWSRHSFHAGAFALIGGVVFSLKILDEWNHWPRELSRLSTAEPYSHQIGASLAGVLAAALVLGLVFGLVGGFVWDRIRRLGLGSTPRVPWWAALGIGGLACGLPGLLRAVGTGHAPWPDFRGVDSSIPLLAGVTTNLMGLLTHGLILSLVILAAHLLRLNQATLRRLLFLALVGIAIGGTGAADSLVEWLLAACTGSIALIVIEEVLFRTCFSLLVVPVAVPFFLASIQVTVSGAYPHSLSSGLLGLLSVVIAVWGMILLGKREPCTASTSEIQSGPLV
jgi:hypothetical protein